MKRGGQEVGGPGRQFTDDENGGVPSTFGRFSLGEVLLFAIFKASINHFWC
jgi:hypothetical protein